MKIDLGVAADSAAKHGNSELERVDYLDGIRGLAIAFVLQGHFLSFHLTHIYPALGVDLFFCLSGLLMSRILFVRRVPLKTFYKRRISRIFPVFALYVVGAYALTWFFDRAHPSTWTEFFSTLFFLRTYIPAYPDIWHTNVPIACIWSLNVEEHCYVLLSLLTTIVILRGREAYVLMTAGVMAIVMHLIYQHFPDKSPPLDFIRTETASSHLLLSAGYFLVRDRFVKYVRPWMPLAALLLGCACFIQGAPKGSSTLISPFLLAFAINHLGDTYKFVRDWLAFSPLRLLGVWSFSIYMWQQPYFEQKDALSIGLSFALAMVTGVISFYYYENPIRAWLNKRW